jgi:phosphate transport system substrate-binding protein
VAGPRERLPGGGREPRRSAGELGVEYEPVGSLAGLLRLKDRAVDFAASDMPLKSDELAALGLGQFPVVMGGVVVAVSADGVPSGRL